ncbi:patched domain-containing protein 3 isoform X1 [Cotesia typhae]|uniref:patched domain-containing protein 3 isoform X1 n=2 Tax=Cotesia typhae TaxID=2053667 RepID=UPI003D696928
MDVTQESVVKRKSVSRLFRRIPQYIATTVENFFYNLGVKIARQPITWMIGSSIVVLLCLGGLYRFRQEKNPLKLWIPPDSDFVKDTEWLMERFDEGQRVETVIMTADDVLQPHVLAEMNEIIKRILAMETDSQPKLYWTDVCFKIPIISGFTNRIKRDIKKDDFFEEEPAAHSDKINFDPSVHAPTDIYCDILNNLPTGCLIFSILDLWEYNSHLILNQTKADIITKINSIKISPTLGHPMNFTELLGGVVIDDAGKIVSAKALKTHWMLHVDFKKINMNDAGNDVGTSDWATVDVLNWEKSFLNQLHSSSEHLKNENSSIKIWYEAGRSFGDISASTMFQDIKKVIIGIILMTLYVQIILSRFNWLEWRFYLTSAGLLCVGAAFIAAVGLCSLFGVPYGPVHSSLPFMLMGLGIDDIFIMMASWEEVLSHQSNRGRPIEERIGRMLSQAGAAISITSLTDVVAFIIGATTILPSLESFCIYAAVGVLVTFLLQVTFFVAAFTLDIKRIESKRNGVIPCIVHKNHRSLQVDPSKTLSWRIINRLYSKIVLTLSGKIVILIITAAVTVVGAIGAYHLEQWFDPNWFLPKESYLSNYIVINDQQFPNRGNPAAIYISDIDYINEFPKLIAVTERLNNMTTIINSVESWPHDFADFVKLHYNRDLINNHTVAIHDFNFYLSKFLFSQSGGRYQKNFRFNGTLKCGKNAPKITLSSISLTFKKFTGPDEWIPAMDSVKLAVKEMNFSNYATVWSKIFAAWVTDKVIAREVTRNIMLALICVMGTTAVLIAEPQTCIWILLCVSLTLVDICGFMYYWGLSVDIVSCIGLELAVGLSVDYAAHVAHAFLNSKSLNDAESDENNRTERALIAVRHIGAAVLYGAGSTLLAQSLLAFSEAYVFRTFFKIFFLVILFGVWHGLLLLPVILSSIGPRSLQVNKTKITKNIYRENKEKTDELDSDLIRFDPQDLSVQISLNTVESD